MSTSQKQLPLNKKKINIFQVKINENNPEGFQKLIILFAKKKEKGRIIKGTTGKLKAVAIRKII